MKIEIIEAFMLFVNLATEYRSRSEFVMATLEQRGAWATLELYCGQHENGGRISGSRQWPEHMWEQAASVPFSAIREDSSLWHWEGDDLVLHLYPVDHEASLKQVREINRDKANQRWAKYRAEIEARKAAQAAQEANAAGTADSTAAGNAKRNGKERKEKKGNEPGSAARPRGFPASLEEAIKAAPDFDPEFVKGEWLEAEQRGGRGYDDRPVRSWPGYLRIQLDYQQDAGF